MRMKLLLIAVTVLLMSCGDSDQDSCIKMERVGSADRFYYEIIFSTKKDLCGKKLRDPTDTLGHKNFLLSEETLRRVQEHILKESITQTQLNDEHYESIGFMFTIKSSDDNFKEYYVLNTDSASYFSFFKNLNFILQEEQDSREVIQLIESLIEE